MNKQRRMALKKIIESLRKFNIKTNGELSQEQIDELDTIKNDLEYVLSEEQYSLDNIPENLQGSYRYQQSESACDSIENAIEFISDAMDGDTEKNINEAIDNVYDAMN